MIDPMPKPKRQEPRGVEDDVDSGDAIMIRFFIGVAMTCSIAAGWFLGSAFPLF